MTTTALLFSFGLCLAAFGLLWAFLTIREIGPLEMIERIGLHLAAWARSQKWAQSQRKVEYLALRGTVYTGELVPLGRRHAE